MREIVRRALNGRPALIAELLRRGTFRAGEQAELLGLRPEYHREAGKKSLGAVQIATLLADGDTQFAARAVVRKVLDRNELIWLDRMLKFQKPTDKRNELARTVERALEGKQNGRRSR